MRQPHLDAIVDVVEPDQAAQVGLLDRFGRGDAMQRRQFDRFADRERIHGVGHPHR
jgi:hypothetical protein